MMANTMAVRGQHFTALNVAVIVTQDELVENLVKRIPQEDDNFILFKALHTAIERGRMRMVKALVGKDSSLENR